MAKPGWFLSRPFHTDTNRSDFERQRNLRHGTLGPAGPVVSYRSAVEVASKAGREPPTPEQWIKARNAALASGKADH